MPRAVVLRIGHRFFRDSRLTTHVCLTARAFGCDGVVLADTEDKDLQERIDYVVRTFGGPFFLETGTPWRKTIKEYAANGWKTVHLTAYGLPLPKVIGEIRAANSNLLVIVGSEKVPGEVYHTVDWNVSITNQPMSEVSALSVFLDWYFQHSQFDRKFEGAKVEIIPVRKGKKVRELDRQ